MAVDCAAINNLLRLPAFDYGEEKSDLFLAAMNDAMRHHFYGCPQFCRILKNNGFHPEKKIENLADFPYLPSRMFKRHQLLSVDSSTITSILLSSATTGQSAQIALDRITARRQATISMQISSAFLGNNRRPLLLLEDERFLSVSGEISARHAASRGFMLYADTIEYLLQQNGETVLIKLKKLNEVLSLYQETSKEVMFFGMTYIVYNSLLKVMQQKGLRFRLHPDSYLLHIGGWKKLEDQQISKAEFLKTANEVLGISPENVLDIYGFTEQMGLIYPSRGLEPKSVPIYSEVIIRDPVTLHSLSDGSVGLVQMLTPVPHSYPGISLLTEDLGRIVPPAPGKNSSQTRFEILGRAHGSEIRGCGNVEAFKMVGNQ